MSWVWWLVALWMPLAVALALVVSRSIRIADRRDLGIGSDLDPSGEPVASPPPPQTWTPSEPV